jgi:hypothetical protein
MKKHDLSYHEHDDLISFHSNHCNHLNVSERFYSNQSQIKKKDFFSKEIFSDQSEIIENKEIKIFFEKINNSKMILNKSVNFNKKLIERFKRLNERRMNKS